MVSELLERCSHALVDGGSGDLEGTRQLLDREIVEEPPPHERGFLLRQELAHQVPERGLSLFLLEHLVGTGSLRRQISSLELGEGVEGASVEEKGPSRVVDPPEVRGLVPGDLCLPRQERPAAPEAASRRAPCDFNVDLLHEVLGGEKLLEAPVEVPARELAKVGFGAEDLAPEPLLSKARAAASTTRIRAHDPSSLPHPAGRSLPSNEALSLI